jgi:cbb3-type cytochrome oxidase maturation protein
MTGLLILVPIALLLGLAGLAAFFWALRDGQFEDPDGAAARILIDEDDEPASVAGRVD